MVVVMKQLALQLLKEFKPELHEESVGLSFNIDEHIAFVNQPILDKLGYDSVEQVKLLHPFMLSPEYQPDGCLSATKAVMMLKQAKVLGEKNFIWSHLTSDGKKIDCHIYLYSVKNHQDVPDYDIFAIWQFL